MKKKAKGFSPQRHRDTEKNKSFKDFSPYVPSITARPDRSTKMRMRIEAAIRAIPKGKVSTYGAVAKAAGFPGTARFVARVLGRGFNLPWQRVLGAGGQIKCPGDYALEQRFRLEAEGVHFRGRRVDMKAHEFKAQLSKRGKQASK